MHIPQLVHLPKQSNGPAQAAPHTHTTCQARCAALPTNLVHHRARLVATLVGQLGGHRGAEAQQGQVGGVAGGGGGGGATGRCPRGPGVRCCVKALQQVLHKR